MNSPAITELWAKAGFTPNDNQRDAILHTEGPLFLTAGPGSGKTRVLLWRTVNLIVHHQVRPEEIFLSTFTEKAAFQLKQGLQSLLGRVTNKTGIAYDLSRMYLGTVHSLCQRLLQDRRFTPNRSRAQQPVLLDALDQYFFFRTEQTLKVLMDAAGVASVEEINAFFGIPNSASQHLAATNCISLFNRFSEENLDPDALQAKVTDENLRRLIEMYACYKTMLAASNQVDFSLLQQRALDALNQSGARANVVGNGFQHVIIDEYQDTNRIQEQLFFKLSNGTRNFCVVGDDDQALYRFRAARVENFVEFPDRCQQYFACQPRQIPLNTNYRSRQRIVTFYKRFINQCDWSRADGPGFYRVASKNIEAHSQEGGASVVATSNVAPEEMCAEIAALVQTLLQTGKVQDANQIAFLFPSLQYQGTINAGVERMKLALERAGFQVYAPRAGRFLDVDEAVAILGVFLHVFGKPEQGEFRGQDLNRFYGWIDRCYRQATEILRKDKALAKYVAERARELETSKSDYRTLVATAEANGWSLDEPYQPTAMRAKLSQTPKLSDAAKRSLNNQYLDRIVNERQQQGKPFALRYIINTATSLDWNVLDLFYRVIGFDCFKPWFDTAETGQDEGPICNLGLLSQYLAGFLEKYTSILTAGYIERGIFHGQFFGQYLYSLYRRGESEYEDTDDPFPKGRIPFLTVHQAKGLEFPVVVLASLNKQDRPQSLEAVIRPLLDQPGEPLDRSPEFDNMRMFYVALSRAQNLLVLAHPSGRGQRVYPAFRDLLNGDLPRLSEFDVASVPAFTGHNREIPRSYSYTADYLMFQRCPRQYMLFRKYGFVPSRSQMQFFGNLVHQTIEDLHQFLIGRREQAAIAKEQSTQ